VIRFKNLKPYHKAEGPPVRAAVCQSRLPGLRVVPLHLCMPSKLFLFLSAVTGPQARGST
jgi:hypothetical protein